MTQPVKKGDPFYVSGVWKALRQTILRRDKYQCRECGVRCLGKKQNAPSPHVDHIEPRKKRPDLALKPSNLQVLCSSCHSRKTLTATMGTEKPRIGLDGFPIPEIASTQNEANTGHERRMPHDTEAHAQ